MKRRVNRAVGVGDSIIHNGWPSDKHSLISAIWCIGPESSALHALAWYAAYTVLATYNFYKVIIVDQSLEDLGGF